MQRIRQQHQQPVVYSLDLSWYMWLNDTRPRFNKDPLFLFVYVFCSHSLHAPHWRLCSVFQRDLGPEKYYVDMCALNTHKYSTYPRGSSRPGHKSIRSFIPFGVCLLLFVVCRWSQANKFDLMRKCLRIVIVHKIYRGTMKCVAAVADQTTRPEDIPMTQIDSCFIDLWLEINVDGRGG